MKKHSSTHSAFLYLRILVGSSIVLAGVSLALLGSGTFSAQAKQKFTGGNGVDPSLLPPGFDCSKIYELGIDKEENLRAGMIMIACGAAEGGSFPHVSAIDRFIRDVLAPLNYGGSDVDLINNPSEDTLPRVTQSETFSWANPDNPNQILVAYNDSRGGAGGSVSTDGGVTFTRLTTFSSQSPFQATAGDPVALYHRPTGSWFTIWLDTRCGGQGIGYFRSTTPSNANSWAHACIHTNDRDDRESGWSDMNPASPFYGRLYLSWNDFNVANGALFTTYSIDGGVTWHSPIQISSGFVRNVQITGDLATGDVYIAAMDEGGGGCGTNRTNLFYRSTDGGNTWANTYIGPGFVGPCTGTCGYFATMFGSYWRHMGWGEPAALNGVVHYVYAQHGSGNDPGDVYYIQSTDRGVTFSAPLRLNTDLTSRPQWQPNLSVTKDGSLLAVWYDARETIGCTRGVNEPCYRMWARQSIDNGMTWGIDMPFSDVFSPLPAQLDPFIFDCYAGDYDYGSAIASKHVSSWVDGRVAIDGIQQQDAFADIQAVGTPSPTPTASPTPTPTCPPAGNYTITSTTGSIAPGTSDTGNHGDDAITSITLPFPVTFYDQTFSLVNISSNGNLQFTSSNDDFNNVCLPAHTMNNLIAPLWDDLYDGDTVGGQGVFTSISGIAPHRTFNIEFKENFCCTSGRPRVNFEVRLHEDTPNFEIIYGELAEPGDRATVGVQRDTGSSFTQFSCNIGALENALQLNFILMCAAPSATPTATFTPTSTPTAAATATAIATATATFTPAPTPTASPSCTPIVVNGGITTADPTQTFRLLRSNIPQTCPASTTCATTFDSSARHYDAYTFTNTTGATQCVTVDTTTACTGTNFIFIAAYLGSFDPNNICTNWIGDAGLSPNPEQAFQFNLNNGETTVIVVSEVTPNAGCPAYTLTITGLCDGGTPTPTATATATATATFTPAPTATATATFTPTATATFTPAPTATATFTPTATATFTPTATATATSTPTPTATVTQITVDGTKCDKFSNGTATNLDTVTYKVDGHGKTKDVKPGKFMYWVKVTAAAGNNTFMIDQLITTGNFNVQFKLDGGGNVFRGSDCKPARDVHMSQDTNTGTHSTVTVKFKAQQAGVYYIAVKFQTGNVNGDPAPAPGTTVHYDFSTTGVGGSTSSVDLVKQ